MILQNSWTTLQHNITNTTQKKTQDVFFRRSATTIRNKSLPASRPPSLMEKKLNELPDSPDSPCSIGAHPSIFPAATKRWIHHNNQLKQLTHHFGQNGSQKTVFQRNQGSKWILQSATARTKRLAKAWRSSRRRWPCKLAFNGLPLGRLRWGDSSGADQSYPHFCGEKWCKYDEICQI